MNIQKIILGLSLTLLCSGAFANETFWRLLSEKRFNEARIILKKDPSIDIYWAPRDGGPPAILMIVDEGVEQEDLLKAAWARRGPSELSYDRKAMRSAAKDAEAAKKMFQTGFETDQFGTPFLLWACLEGDLDLVKYFFDQIPGDRINSLADIIGDTPLHYAIAGDRLDIVRYLRERGVNLQAPNYRGETPLVRALKTVLKPATKRGQRPVNTVKIVEILTVHAALLDEVDLDGMTALHYAAQLAQATIAKRLLKMGANVDIVANNGLTPLRAAIRAGRKQLVKLLLMQGINSADPNQVSEDGTSALHDAASSGNLDLVKMLIEAGARVDIANLLGETPLDLARPTHREVANYLIERGAQAERRLVRARSFDDLPPNRRARQFELSNIPRLATEPDLEVQDEETPLPPNKRRTIIDLTDPTLEEEVRPIVLEMEPQFVVPVMTREEILRDILRIVGVVGVHALYAHIKFGKNL